MRATSVAPHQRLPTRRTRGSRPEAGLALRTAVLTNPFSPVEGWSGSSLPARRGIAQWPGPEASALCSPQPSQTLPAGRLSESPDSGPGSGYPKTLAVRPAPRRFVKATAGNKFTATEDWVDP